MALYSVHVKGDGLEAAAEAVFVNQAFNRNAFFFGPFWLGWHGLWAALTLWVAAFLALLTASRSVLSATATFAIAVAGQILLGLEAAWLREAKLAAQGHRLAEVIAAPSSDQAEATFLRQFEPPDAALAGAGAAALLGTDP